MLEVQARLPFAWGVHADELARSYPCDAQPADADHALIRGVDVAASQKTVFRWLCQLRVAPYSYDWIDNWGRKSPPRLIAGLDELVLGQEFCTIFELIEFEAPRQITLRSDTRAFGSVICSYVVEPAEPGQSRLVCKLLVRYPRDVMGAIRRALLPAGDLVMMRKQLLTLKRYAERSEARISS